MDWQKIFTNDATKKGLISKKYKQFIQLNKSKLCELLGLSADG